MSDLDNPDAFVRDFVDKDLGVTFLIHKSGENSVYASKPFRDDYIVYSDDKEPVYCDMNSARRDCPGKDDTTKCPGHPTRSFEGYLRQQGGGWTPYRKEGRQLPGHFESPEQAAYVIYRSNRAESAAVIVNTMLEDVPVPDAKATQRQMRKMFTPGSEWRRVNYRFPTKLVSQGGQLTTIPVQQPVTVKVVKAIVDAIVFQLPDGQSSYLSYPDQQNIIARFVYPAGVELGDARGTVLSYRPI